MEKRLLKAELVKICNKAGSLEQFLIRRGLKAAVCFISDAACLPGLLDTALKIPPLQALLNCKAGILHTFKNILGLL